MSIRDIAPMAPMQFFSVQADVSSNIKKMTLLPDTSPLLDQDRFADVLMQWSCDGITFLFKIKGEYQGSYFPQFEKGDAIELFIDTRDLKSSLSVTRFCHHFVIFPQSVDDTAWKELTRFKGEEERDLAPKGGIEVDTDFGKRGYNVHVTVHRDALFGFDPSSFDRLGFTYCIHRAGKESQHFALSSKRFKLAKHPNMWATLNLRK